MKQTYRQAITETMEQMLAKHPETVLYGLGATDSIGIFGTTKGLCEKFGPDRVFDTPISEDSLTGFAVGLALQGFYPITVHIRNDFLLLAMNQLVNSIAKYRSMYGGLYRTRMLIRAVIGRSWGQGAQHSQSLQSLLAHIPGLTVIMPSSAEAISSCYWEAIHSYPGPVISLEHRFLYDYEFYRQPGSPQTSIRGSRLVQEGNDVTVVASSYMVQEFQKILPMLRDLNISIELIDVHSITHPNKDMLLASLKKTRRLVVADTSWGAFGLAAEVSRWIAEADPTILRAPLRNLCLAPTPCPTSHSLEKFFYPSLEQALNACFELKFGEQLPTARLPSTEAFAALEKKFKGPF